MDSACFSPDCNSTVFEETDSGERICVQCGLCQADGSGGGDAHLVAPANPGECKRFRGCFRDTVGHSSIIRQAIAISDRNSAAKRPSRQGATSAHKALRQFLMSCCDRLKFRHEDKQAAYKLFQKIIARPEFKFKSVGKNPIALACVYIIARQNDHNYGMKAMTDITSGSVSPKDLRRYVRAISEHCPDMVPQSAQESVGYQPNDEFLTSLLNSYKGLRSEHEKCYISRTAPDLVHIYLAERPKVSTSRELLYRAAIYWCWKTVDPTERGKVDYKQFCSLQKMVCVNSMPGVVCAMGKVLIALGRDHFDPKLQHMKMSQVHLFIPELGTLKAYRAIRLWSIKKEEDEAIKEPVIHIENAEEERHAIEMTDEQIDLEVEQYICSDKEVAFRKAAHRLVKQ